MILNPKNLFKSIIKSIPGSEYFINFHQNSGGSTLSARYCYSVWMRHLSLGWHHGLKSVPRKIAELGPGDSLGVGICALISGAETYFAFDVIKYQPAQVNIKIFDEVVCLFKTRAAIPGIDEFPKLKPYLEDYSFPSHIFTNDFLEKLLNGERLANIRQAIVSISKNDEAASTMISYKIPWNKGSLVNGEKLDMILSQAVLQHVNELESTYDAMAAWLRPGGFMSHQLDFTSMGSSDKLQGHWEYSDMEWKLVKGRMKYYINREPYSAHLHLHKKYHFKIIHEKKITTQVPANPQTLATRFKTLSPEDLQTTALFIQSVKQ